MLSGSALPITALAELAAVKDYALALEPAGRDQARFTVRAPLMAGDGGKAAWIAAATKLRDPGVTHIGIAAPPGQGLGRIVEARAALTEALG